MASVHAQEWYAGCSDEHRRDIEERFFRLNSPERPSEEADDVGTPAWWDRLLPWKPSNDPSPTYGNYETLLAPSESPKFCESCHAIFEDCSAERWARALSLREFYRGGGLDRSYPGFRRWRPLHLSAEAIRTGARQGCLICMHMLGQQPNNETGTVYHMSLSYIAGISIKVHTADHTFLIDPLWRHGFIYRRWDGGNEGARFDLGHVRESIKPLLRLHEASVAQPIGSASSLRLARHWYEECTEHHTCRKTSRPSWYPSRILRIDGDYVRLLETQFHDLQQPYATLSHCWGKDSFTVLDPSTIASFKAGRLRSGFLPTFRECFATLEYLGISLVWIDSYCILQGTSSRALRDWECESALMQNVYLNSAITITAAYAASPQDGCFNPAPRNRTLNRSQIQWRPARSESRRWWEVVSRSLELKDLESEHLFSRAWVLQERLLSSRLSHFGTEQMFWQCSEADGDNYITELELGDAWMREFPQIEPDMLWFSAPWVWDHDDDDEVRRKWETILEAYTSAKLTNAHKDKLIAIDGIMSYLAAVRKTWYTCGMFWKDLPQALCWQQVGVAPAQRATPYRAPSWSWASVDGEIMMPFVWEVAGTTRLTCALDTMTWVQNGTLKTALLCVGRTLALLPPHDRQDITNPRAYRVYTFYGQQVRLKFDNETEELTLTHRRFYYFPVVHVDLEVSGTQVRGSNAPRRMQAVDHNAILLVKNSDGTFSRVGQTSHNHNTVQCLLSPLLAAIQAQPAQLVVLV